jgi:hypothetical protein
MDIDAKLRPLYLTKILRERTDEDHYLTTPQLCAILKDEYGMETHRTTIKTDIEMLQQAGIGIQAVRSTQNQYNYIGREFDIAELKLLIDAVESSKFITKSKSEQLVAKLTSFAGAFKGRELKRNLAVDGRIKQENEQIFYIVDAINKAINTHKKILFIRSSTISRRSLCRIITAKCTPSAHTLSSGTAISTMWSATRTSTRASAATESTESQEHLRL